MRKNIFLAVGVLFMALTLHAQQYDTVCEMKNAFVVVPRSENTFTDSRDSNVYKYVTICNQTWMAENLKYLPNVVEKGTGSETAPCYYVHSYDGTSVAAAKATDNYKTYGVLYNWPAAMASSASSIINPSGVQGVCPEGWHLPSDDEWTELTKCLGDSTGSTPKVAGGKLKETGIAHWWDPNTGATNEVGFTALPSSCRQNNGTFVIIGHAGYWWSATEHESSKAWRRALFYDNSHVDRNSYTKEWGYSVRCVKN